ncbi:glycosyltransferase family 61 protein [Simkania negevensis]|uniref:Glycosyltransferase family 61 protein n=1 Tax=Simkania negevensis TaxID=83561 RepID=A0ABS3ARV9_9BACT|nr:glycosyltransferase family 61 protein [Simkania negevensis]
MRKRLLAPLLLILCAAFFLSDYTCPLLQRLPFSSETFGPVKGVVAPEEVRGEVFAVHSPESASDCGTFVVVLENGRVVGRDGDVITAEDRLLLDTSLHSHRSLRSGAALKKHHLFRRLKLPRVRKVDETVAVVASGASNCYYHWMSEVVTKIEILKRSGISYDKIYVSKIEFPYQKETLEMMGVDPAKIIEGHRSLQIKAKKLVVPTLHNLENPFPQWAAEAITKAANVDSGSQRKRIFISRAETVKRHILNEEQLFIFLQRQGFEKVFLEKMSVKEQAQLLHAAEVVIAPHGAGLTNLIFCQKGTRVIELDPPGIPAETCYAVLSRSIGLVHQHLHGSLSFRNSREQLRYRFLKKDRYRDMTIDIDAFQSLVNQTI